MMCDNCEDSKREVDMIDLDFDYNRLEGVLKVFSMCPECDMHRTLYFYIKKAV